MEKHNIRRTSITPSCLPSLAHDAATASAPPTAAPTATIATVMPLLTSGSVVVCCGGV